MDTARFRTSGPAGGLTVAAIQKIRITKDLVYVHVTNHLSVTSSRLFEQENPDLFYFLWGPFNHQRSGFENADHRFR